MVRFQISEVRRTRKAAWAPLLAAALILAGCGGSDKDEILVSAAASLTDVFSALEAAFEAAHPEADVILNFGGTAALREQVLEGAPVDVFASADLLNMDAVVQAGLVIEGPLDFAANRIQIAVPPGNPGRVGTIDDLAKDDLLVGLCAPTVPCGSLARDALAERGIDVSAATEEPDVRALMAKLEAGELDAGMVYVTDVLTADGAVVGLDLPFGIDPRSTYAIAVVMNGAHPAGASDFLAFVMSTEGQAILRAAGFDLP